METQHCQACDAVMSQDVFRLIGHRCFEGTSSIAIKEKWAKEILAKQKVEAELAELETFLLPLAKHHTGEYNRWRQLKENKNKPGWIEALNHITNYVKGNKQPS